MILLKLNGCTSCHINLFPCGKVQKRMCASKCNIKLATSPCFSVSHRRVLTLITYKNYAIESKNTLTKGEQKMSNMLKSLNNAYI